MNNQPSIIIVSMLISLLLSGCFGNVPKKETKREPNPISEPAANLPHVKIGEQRWMPSNLNVSTFRNGDPIPEAKTAEEWQKAGINKQPAWCYYENDSTHGSEYGRMYNWYAVNDPRGLAPRNWHIPSRGEWNVLVEYLGGSKVAGEKLKSTLGWERNGNGTNGSGFSALPAGERHVDGEFSSMGLLTTWWTSTQEGYESAWFRHLLPFNTIVYDKYCNKSGGNSVRCVLD